MINKCEICGIKYKNWGCFLDYPNREDNSIKCKCLCCNNNYQKSKFSNHDINKFILLLRKGVYEYMDDQEKFNETSLAENNFFTVTSTWKILLMQISRTVKELVRIFK